MTYRPLPEPLPKPPAGFFIAVGRSAPVVNRPNWLLRTFPPAPYKYVSYTGREEGISAHFYFAGLFFLLLFGGLPTLAIATGTIWCTLIMLGLTGLFHRNIEIAEWKETQ